MVHEQDTPLAHRTMMRPLRFRPIAFPAPPYPPSRFAGHTTVMPSEGPTTSVGPVEPPSFGCPEGFGIRDEPSRFRLGRAGWTRRGEPRWDGGDEVVLQVQVEWDEKEDRGE
jgi:hypothetical protein